MGSGGHPWGTLWARRDLGGVRTRQRAAPALGVTARTGPAAAGGLGGGGDAFLGRFEGVGVGGWPWPPSHPHPLNSCEGEAARRGLGQPKEEAEEGGEGDSWKVRGQKEQEAAAGPREDSPLPAGAAAAAG